MNLNGKKLFIIGFIVVLLVGIPLTIYLLQQQTNTQQHAQASTNLAFSPDTSAAAPLQKNVGDTIPLDITVDPGKNLVSFVKLEIQYDPTILATPSADAFKPNTTAFPSVLEGPVFTPGKIAVTLSVGPDPTKAIQQKVTAGTVTFTALKNTPPGTPTLVTFTSSTQVLSIGSSDQASENVLSSASPATIAIGGTAPPSESIPPGTPTPTPVVSQSPSAAPTAVPSAEPTATPATSPTPTPSVAVSSGPNSAPTCNSLTLDRGATGNAPYSLTFTANGTDTDGTINKVSFNFGDGQVSDVTQAGGIGTASVNVQASHTYNNPGTFTATAVLTDNGNATSTAGSGCTQNITINAASSSASTGGGVVTNPSPTMPPTGSTGLAVGLGLGAMLLIVGGGLLFFIL
ncbi:MAG TPA: PKD domain-containing protein [Candidatus Acidoferrales bacterium]|nr:PKD domain-containing protein [Candidatus Acidoferrales bacterium]